MYADIPCGESATAFYYHGSACTYIATPRVGALIKIQIQHNVSSFS